MKIQEVTVEGYQSHLHSTFTLSPGLTVITGPSDAGKTAIIRALRWFAFNEPTGEAFLHTIRNADGSIKEAVDQAKVSVTFDNGITITKTRRKGKTSYTHSLYPTGWEKAEVPPEVKEALGLIKQKYGDFETCLNFAFQLDPPFLLSETNSTGAKVLGKLAGTEVVDRSISEVNKRTHQTRTDISYADKQIGEIDVELIEYFQLDDLEKALTGAEMTYESITGTVKRIKELSDLEVAHEGAVSQVIRHFDTVERLAGVVVAAAELSQVERQHTRGEALTDLATSFWKAVNDQKEPSRVLRLTEGLPELQTMLRLLSESVDNYEALLELNHKHDQAVGRASRCKVWLYKLVNVDDLTATLDQAVEAADRLETLNTLRSTSEMAQDALNVLSLRTDRLNGLDALQAQYEATEVIYKKLVELVVINQQYSAKKHWEAAFLDAVKEQDDLIEEAQAELSEAWGQAGGVCPLCGSEGVGHCTH